MTRTVFRYLLAVLVCISCLGANTSAFASHLRGTSVSWAPTGVTGQVQFTIQYSQRASFGGCSTATCAVGSTVQVPFNFGDGASANVSTTITSLNSAEDYFSSVGTILHTYTGAGPYTASYSVCCRISTILSGENDTLQMETTVSPMASPVNHSPVVSMPAIITLPLQPTTGFFVSASDADHDVLSYRLATAGEMYAASPFSCVMQEPPGLSVNSSTGQVTWDTTQIVKAGCGYAAPKSGDLWTVQIMVQDLDANGNVKSKVPLDVILKFVTSTEAPPTLALSNPGPITVQAGSTLTFTATGDDAATDSRITLNTAGVPLGATVTETNVALIPAVVSQFTWTPTVAQAGSYVITYTATNDTFEQVLQSVTIFVVAAKPPVVSCAASLSGTYGSAVSFVDQVSDPQGEAVTVVVSVDGSVVSTDPIAATAGTTTIPLSEMFTTVGAHTVSINATNTSGFSSNCSTGVTVAQAAQAITFAPAATASVNSTVVLSATGGASGNPVTYTVTGPATLAGNVLTINGAGTVTVTANQAGNTDYLAAPPVVRSISTALTATVTLSASNASLTYPNSTNLDACVKLATGHWASGTISIYDGATLLTTQPVQGGGCFNYYIQPSLNVGAHTLTAYYNDAANSNVFSAPLLLTVTAGATQAEVDCWQHGSFAYGPDFQCDANTDSGPSGGYFTYSYDGGPAMKVLTNGGGHALFTLPKPGVGNHTVVIVYPAQGNYGAFTLPLQAFTVTLAPVNVALSASTYSTTKGQTATLTAAVTSWSAGPPNSSGTVSFFDGSSLVGTVAVDAGGSAAFTTGVLKRGTHTYTATYNGSASYGTGSGTATISVGK